ncbi:MAG: STAS domain-containing protein [Planctomycetota bacterium]
MPVVVRRDGDRVVLEIPGRFDFNVQHDFRQAYRSEDPGHEYVVDLAETEYVDSAALGMLLMLRDHAGGDQAKVLIENCSPPVRKLLERARCDEFFPITEA